jgi:hypothetical protein
MVVKAQTKQDIRFQFWLLTLKRATMAQAWAKTHLLCLKEEISRYLPDILNSFLWSNLPSHLTFMKYQKFHRKNWSKWWHGHKIRVFFLFGNTILGLKALGLSSTCKNCFENCSTYECEVGFQVCFKLKLNTKVDSMWKTIFDVLFLQLVRGSRNSQQKHKRSLPIRWVFNFYIVTRPVFNKKVIAKSDKVMYFWCLFCKYMRVYGLFYFLFFWIGS